MTQEEKDLLIKDLCARLPYGVKVLVNNKIHTINAFYDDGSAWLDDKDDCSIEEIKPYLRPMSSMTDEEILQLFVVRGKNLNSFELRSLIEDDILIVSYLPFYSRHIDWLNEHQFDYRGLIEKGLALEAPNWIYK